MTPAIFPRAIIQGALGRLISPGGVALNPKRASCARSTAGEQWFLHLPGPAVLQEVDDASGNAMTMSTAVTFCAALVLWCRRTSHSPTG